MVNWFTGAYMRHWAWKEYLSWNYMPICYKANDFNYTTLMCKREHSDIKLIQHPKSHEFKGRIVFLYIIVQCHIVRTTVGLHLRSLAKGAVKNKKNIQSTISLCDFFFLRNHPYVKNWAQFKYTYINSSHRLKPETRVDTFIKLRYQADNFWEVGVICDKGIIMTFFVK